MTIVTTLSTATAVDHFAPIGLGELVRTADLQTRRERKYLLPAESLAHILDGVHARALEIDGLRSFRYESVYFDTAERDSYLGATRRRPRRFKVRTRTYHDSHESMLEVKTRDHRGNTVKDRHAYDADNRHIVTGEGMRFLLQNPASAPYAERLTDVLSVTYRRSTLLLDVDQDIYSPPIGGHSPGTDSSRVTIDHDICWHVDGARPIELTGMVLIETKTPGPPGQVDRALWRSGHRPVKISKYCTGLAAFEPTLPSNRWHRVLAQHLLRPATI